MAQKALVHCRLCKREIDREHEQEGIDWIMPSRNFYYCTKCYNDWKVSSTHDDEDWIDLIYDFIARDLKVGYDYHMCEAQRKKYIKSGKYTNKGIYFTLKYFYEIKTNDWNKGHGGIGIVEYVYKEATEYWTQLEIKKRGTMSQIEAQIRERAMRPVQKVTRLATVSTSTAVWNLDEI